MNMASGALAWPEQEPGLPEPVLGQDDQTWLVQSISDWQSITDCLVGQARKQLWIYERQLDHERYDREPLRERISALARRHRHSDIRFLIHDERPLIERSHRLVQLIRRLPSFVQLRLANADYPLPEHAFLLIDQSGILYRHRFDAPVGFANFHAPGRVSSLADEFQRLWETARPSAELRQLSL